MRITHFFAKGPGPLNGQSGGLYDLDLTDGGYPAEHILLSGPSGSGKTTLLLAMAQLWQGLGGLMRGKPPMGLMRSDCAMVVEDLADNPLTLFLTRDQAFLEALPKGPRCGWMLEADGPRPVGTPPGLKQWPNVILLDTDTQPCPDKDSLPRDFLITDEMLTDFQRAPQRILQRLNHENPRQYQALNEIYTQLLGGKRLMLKPEPHVVLPSGAMHPIGALSRGERALLMLMYAAVCLLKPGGVLLLDHPDIHLHPEQTDAFLSALELVVEEKRGQMLLTSHRSEVWRRYDQLGIRIRMEGEP